MPEEDQGNRDEDSFIGKHSDDEGGGESAESGFDAQEAGFELVHGRVNYFAGWMGANVVWRS